MEIEFNISEWPSVRKEYQKRHELCIGVRKIHSIWEVEMFQNIGESTCYWEGGRLEMRDWSNVSWNKICSLYAKWTETILEQEWKILSALNTILGSFVDLFGSPEKLSANRYATRNFKVEIMKNACVF